MQRLNYPWVWWALGWLLVAGVVVGSLLPGNLAPDLPVRDKLLHAGSYLLLMVWFSGLYNRERHLLIAALLLMLGLALDFAQSASPGRSFELADVAANASGILAGLLLARFALANWCQRVEQLFLPR